MSHKMLAIAFAIAATFAPTQTGAHAMTLTNCETTAAAKNKNIDFDALKGGQQVTIFTDTRERRFTVDDPLTTKHRERLEGFCKEQLHRERRNLPLLTTEWLIPQPAAQADATGGPAPSSPRAQPKGHHHVRDATRATLLTGSDEHPATENYLWKQGVTLFGILMVLIVIAYLVPFVAKAIRFLWHRLRNILNARKEVERLTKELDEERRNHWSTAESLRKAELAKSALEERISTSGTEYLAATEALVAQLKARHEETQKLAGRIRQLEGEKTERDSMEDLAPGDRLIFELNPAMTLQAPDANPSFSITIDQPQIRILGSLADDTARTSLRLKGKFRGGECLECAEYTAQGLVWLREDIETAFRTAAGNSSVGEPLRRALLKAGIVLRPRSPNAYYIDTIRRAKRVTNSQGEQKELASAL